MNAKQRSQDRKGRIRSEEFQRMRANIEGIERRAELIEDERNRLRARLAIVEPDLAHAKATLAETVRQAAERRLVDEGEKALLVATLGKAEAEVKQLGEHLREASDRLQQLEAEERDAGKLRRRLADKQKEVDRAHAEANRLKAELAKGRSLVA